MVLAKNRKIQNNKQPVVIVLYAFAFIAFIISIALIIAIYLPSTDLDKYYDVNPFVYGVRNTTSVVVPISSTIIGIWIKDFAFKDGISKTKKKNRFILCIIPVIIFSSPLIVSAIGSSYMDNYKEEIVSQQKSDENSDNKKKNSSKDNVSFKIDFNDPLLQNYSFEVLNNNVDGLLIAINDSISLKIIDFNINADGSKYDDKTGQAFNPEKAYELYCKNNLYKNYNIEERYTKTNDAIKLREEANDFKLTSENQKLLSLRYIDLANEQVNNEDILQSIGSYKLAITWALSGLNTASNENSTKNIDELYSNIIESYNYIAMYSNDDNIVSRAKLLGNLFEKYQQKHT